MVRTISCRSRAISIGCLILFTAGVWLATASAAPAGGKRPEPAKPIIDRNVLFEEVDGVVAVEAEHFHVQELTDTRAWYLFSPEQQPQFTRDADPPHLQGASGGAYLEILPDTRATHGDQLRRGENFSNEPGKMAVLHYRVKFNTPGRYYVWARIYSTGTEDNGLHVGLDSQWPESGRRMQWTAKRRWVWGSKQRTEQQHGGVKHQLFLDINKPGLHTICFSMREDGTEFDKWMMTRQRRDNVQGTGPQTRLARGKLPAPFEANSTFDATADLLSLHYDHAPDRDDGHSAAADRTILEAMYGPQWLKEHTVAVSGAYGENRGAFQPASDKVMEVIWSQRGGWLDAHHDREKAMAKLVARWRRTLQAGGDIWVKEGGQSDLTADAVKAVQAEWPNLDTTRRIHVVQHSNWNENKTTDEALAYTKKHTDYIRIPDANRFLNRKGGDTAFEQAATQHPVFGPGWKAAFEYYSPRKRLDFSDTGELLHILGLGELGFDALREKFLEPDKQSGS